MECQICFSTYELPAREPLVLSCGHTFCCQCVESLSRSASSQSVRCPTCRSESSTATIHINFALRDALLGPAATHHNEIMEIVAPVIEAPSEEELSIDMKVSMDVSVQHNVSCDNCVELMLSLVPPEGKQRTPSDICCVVDVSDSMAVQASVQDSPGLAVTHGLCVLDVVKHALRTIVHNLESNDRLAVVAFAENAKVVFNLTAMVEEGKRIAEAQLEALHTDGGLTNLWRGLEIGIEILDCAQEPGRLQHLMLLTDGVPTWSPPRGTTEMLRRLKEKKEKSGSVLPCTLSTFGFGYELDSQMLKDIAVIGGGTYAFIPDAGFVGTTFVNAMTNLLVTMATNVTITLKPLEGASFAPNPVLGGYPIKRIGSQLRIDLNSLQYGQRKDIIVVVATPSVNNEFMHLTLKCNTRAENKDMLRVGQDWSIGGKAFAGFDLEPQRCRFAFIDGVRQGMEMMKLTSLDKMRGVQPLPEVQAHVQTLATRLMASRSASSEEIQALIEDVTGQVAEACSREDWYNKWGVHYLPSLTCAHLSQQCNNFKDPGVQNYGGPLFSALRDQADDIFCSLPAPTASKRPPVVATTSSIARSIPDEVPLRAAPAPVVSMATYYDRYAG